MCVSTNNSIAITKHLIILIMYLNIAVCALAVVVPAVLAEELRAGDVPSACTAICQPIISLTNTCDIDSNEKDGNKRKRQILYPRAEGDSDEAIEAECICKNKSFDVANIMALCASCITQNGHKKKGTSAAYSRFGGIGR